MVNIMRETFPKNLSIVSHAPASLWPIQGDPTQLHQVLLNLCINARDAMPNGGALSVKAENTQFDEQYASMKLEAKPGPYVRLEVSDTGIGIPAANLERIFDPFFTTQEQGKGTGLGLSTVIGIVKSHGGFVDVRSQVGKGSVFEVYLPAAPDTLAQEAAPEKPLLPKDRGETILLVDDEPAIRVITQKTLTKYGYQVITAADGAEAIALYIKHQQAIKAVLSDLLMPRMDGLIMARALRKLDPTVKIVISSGIADGFDAVKRAELRNLDIKVVLSKPYSAETLLTALHDLIHGSADQSLA
jgi:CheY-like chemotaxis protein